MQAEESEGVTSQAEANSAFSLPSDDDVPPPSAAASHDPNAPSSTSPSSTSPSDQQFCASAICINHTNNNSHKTNNSNSDSPTSTSTLPQPPTIPLKPCPKCHGVTYCSRPCQKADWKQHKKTCAAMAQLRFLQTSTPVQQQSSRKVPRDRGNEQRLRKWQFDT